MPLHRSFCQAGSALIIVLARGCGGGTEPEAQDPVLSLVSGDGFPNAGSFDYLCAVHGASMSGTIIVE